LTSSEEIKVEVLILSWGSRLGLFFLGFFLLLLILLRLFLFLVILLTFFLLVLFLLACTCWSANSYFGESLANDLNILSNT